MPRAARSKSCWMCERFGRHQMKGIAWKESAQDVPWCFGCMCVVEERVGTRRGIGSTQEARNDGTGSAR